MTKSNKYDNYTKDELIDELETLKKKKYGLVWDKKNSQEILDAFVNWENVPENFVPKQFPVLKEIKNKEIKTDKTKPVNLLIEGDNYHSLAVLNFTHQSKIDLIYIDPPYNTGNEDFIYNDKFIDKEDPYRHSKWLSFMDKRLRLALGLLKDTGAIFISIDDNEQAQLRLLCDEIFGEQNFVSTIIWQRAYSPKNQSRHISIDHEYILVYAKDIEHLNVRLLPRTDKMNARYKNPDNDPRGVWKPGDIVANEERKTGHYIITGPKGDKFDAPAGKHWSYAQDNMLELQKDNRLYFGKNGNAFPSLKQFLDEVQQGRKASTLFFHEEVGHNDEAKKELKDFFEQSDDLFSTPKPTRLIKQILRLIGDKNAVVLDFMAGSGTTGQAVLALNDEDRGERSFILCTNNGDEKAEHKIASDICYPRIKKSILGYKKTKGDTEKGLGGNLKYFKTDFVGSDANDKNKRDLVKQSTEMICIKEDVFDLMIDEGFDFKIYQKGKKFLGIVFDMSMLEAFKKEAEKHIGDFSVYCFSYNETTPDKEFVGLKNKYTFKPIPAVILKVYLEIFKK
ncbi:MAG: site-specific DNA-methyltransferase [Patescibacteria group bacterium]